MLLVLHSCIDPLDVTFKGRGEELMVEGLITDEPGPYTIRLSNRLSYLGYYDGLVKTTKAKIVLF
ncbi:MAG: DUF4249 domain-containing protein, partial [Flammeovirgaceae bacterium]